MNRSYATATTNPYVYKDINKVYASIKSLTGTSTWPQTGSPRSPPSHQTRRWIFQSRTPIFGGRRMRTPHWGDCCQGQNNWGALLLFLMLMLQMQSKADVNLNSKTNSNMWAECFFLPNLELWRTMKNCEVKLHQKWKLEPALLVPGLCQYFKKLFFV